MTEFLDLVRELTKREMEVLAVVWVNRTGSALDVAGALCLSEAAVRFHLGNIYRKLGVKGKIALLFLCQEAGFAEAAPPVGPWDSARTERVTCSCRECRAPTDWPGIPGSLCGRASNQSTGRNSSVTRTWGFQ